MKKTQVIVFVLLILLIGLCFSSIFTVSEKEVAIITQFGKPVRSIMNAGLYFKLPGVIQKVNTLDKRVDIFKSQPIQLLLGDKNPIIATCYVCWRIYDPLLFFQSLMDTDIAKQKLSDMVNSQLGSTLGDYTIENIINTDDQYIKLEEIESRIMTNANEKTKDQYGIEIISVGIRRINYPSIVADSVYERMRAEREKEAMKYRAEGKEEAAKIRAQTNKVVAGILSEAYKEAEIIKGKGDKDSIGIYAEAYGKNPELFNFMKSMETLRESLKTSGTLILSTDSEIFKYLDYQNTVNIDKE